MLWLADENPLRRACRFLVRQMFSGAVAGYNVATSLCYSGLILVVFLDTIAVVVVLWSAAMLTSK